MAFEPDFQKVAITRYFQHEHKPTTGDLTLAEYAMRSPPIRDDPDLRLAVGHGAVLFYHMGSDPDPERTIENARDDLVRSEQALVKLEDSLESLRKDFDEFIQNYWHGGNVTLDDMHKMVAALVEKDAAISSDEKACKAEIFQLRIRIPTIECFIRLPSSGQVHLQWSKSCCHHQKICQDLFNF